MPNKKDRVVVTIGVASDNPTGVNLAKLAEAIEGAAKTIGVKKSNIKIVAHISLRS